MDGEKKTTKPSAAPFVSIYQKIQIVRVELQKMEIKMSGKIGGREDKPYLELADFLKPLNELMLEQKFTAIATFAPDIATLTAYDFDSDQTHAITSPMRDAKVPGCNDMQNLGAVETYQRRYLYMAMFDVSESDVLDGSLGDKNKGADKKPIEKPSPELLKEAQALGVDLAKVAVHYKTPIEDLSAGQIAECVKMQKLAIEKQKAKTSKDKPAEDNPVEKTDKPVDDKPAEKKEGKEDKPNG